MADLNSLFQNLGPTGGALMSGLNMGQEMVSAQQQDQLRQAQMEEILQRAAAAKEMAPLELKVKQQAISDAEAKSKAEAVARRGDFLARHIPTIESAPGPARLATLQKLAAAEGIDIPEEHFKSLQGIGADKLPTFLKHQRENDIKNTAAYRQAMDVAREHSRSAENVANIGARSRETIADSKKKATDIVSQVQSGKLSAEKAAVAFDVMASMETDPTQRQLYQQQAEKFTLLAKQLKSAPVDAAAAQRNQLLNQLSRSGDASLGTGLYDPPPAAPRGSAANPIQIK